MPKGLSAGFLKYKRSKFSTHLPTHFHYTKSHFWVNAKDNILTIGLTKLAVRMLGELVEYEFEISSNKAFKKGDIIGWIEGLKANSDLYAITDGEFLTENSNLTENPELFFKKPYSDGWLYQAKGELQDDLLSANEYVTFLDQTIDGMEPR
jgi:glycine cleavage system H protein